MNKILIEIETKEQYTIAEEAKLNRIFQALIKTGGLIGMRNGSTSIHFDKNANFVGIKHEYWPWKERN